MFLYIFHYMLKPAAKQLLIGLMGIGWLVFAGKVATAQLSAPTLPVSEIKPGMKGYALTVFSGTQTDRFEIEVIDVVHDYLPNQDTILFRSSDPRMQHSGIVGGMSGSPVFINDKLVGAVAYGYRFNKDPIGGITPIKDMLAVSELPFRPHVLPRPKTGAWTHSKTTTATWADAMLGLNVSPLPARSRPHFGGVESGLAPLPVPLAIGGLGPSATSMLGNSLGMIPVQGGSGGAGKTKHEAGNAPKKQWKPGDSVSVMLIRGDNAAAANGTVTWVGGKQGERLLAFGHPMFNAGPTNLPIADARVHVIIPSVERSVKLSSPLSQQGAMIQDRQAAIALHTDIEAPMIPVTTTLHTADSDLRDRVYKSAVAIGVDLTPSLISALLMDAVEEGGSDMAELTTEVVHKIALETSQGPRMATISEELFFPLGVDLQAVGRGRGILVLAALLDNQFEIAQIRSVEQKITMRYEAPVDFIEEVRIPQQKVHAGELLTLQLCLRNRRGASRIESFDLRIPDDAAGQEIVIEIAGGSQVWPYRPMPKSLDDLIDTLEQKYPERSFVATIYRQKEGLSTREGLLADLPPSVLESLSIQGKTTSNVRLKQMARRVIPTKSLMEGEHQLELTVLPPRIFNKSG